MVDDMRTASSTGTARYVLAPPVTITQSPEAVYNLNDSEVEEEDEEEEDDDDVLPGRFTPRLPSLSTSPLTPQQAALESPPSPAGSSKFPIWPAPRSPSLREHSPNPRLRSASSSCLPSSSADSARLTLTRSPSTSTRSMTPPASPAREYRCRVSLDATPDGLGLSMARASSRSSSLQWDEQQIARRASAASVPDLRATASTPCLKHRRSSERSRSQLHNVHWAVEEDEDENTYVQPTHLHQDVDHHVRSAPGVVGLGEGWAGGPQRRASSSNGWFKRRRTVEEDPLALWSPGSGSRTTSLREKWNRSRRSVFGASTSALHDRPATPSTASKRLSMLNLFGRSHSTLNLARSSPPRSTLDPTTHPRGIPYSPDIDSTPKASQSGFDRNLHSPAASTSIHPTVEASSEAMRTRQTSESIPISPREGTADRSPTIPSRSASLSSKGPRPPWRPRSMVGARKAVPRDIAIDDAMAGPSSSGRLLGSVTSTPKDETASQALCDDDIRPSLKRISTFGHEEMTSEPMQYTNGDEAEPVPGLDTIAAWASGQANSPHRSNGTAHHKPLPAIPIPTSKRRGSLHKRSPSLFSRMKEAVTAAIAKVDSAVNDENSSRPKTPTLDRFIPTTRRSQTDKVAQSSTSSYADEYEEGLVGRVPLKASSPPAAEAGTKHRRRRSWSALQGSSFTKRLSKLTEAEHERDFGLAIEQEQEQEHRTDADPDRNASSNSFVNRLRSHRASSSLSILTPRSRTPLPTFGTAHQCAPSATMVAHTGLSASVSLPALSNYSMPDLNLHIDLAGSDLGLDDILDEERRENYVEHMSPKAREAARAATRAALDGSNSNGSTSTSASVGGSRTSSSDPTPTRHSTSTHSKNPSSSSGASSGTALHLVTPKFSDAGITFTPLYAISPPVSPECPWPASPVSPVLPVSPMSPKLGPLALASSPMPQRRESVLSAGKRSSVTSWASRPSLDEVDSGIEQRAVRITSLADMRSKASVVSLGEMTRGLALRSDE